MSTWEVIYKSAWVALGILFLIGAACMFLPKWREYRGYQRRQAEVAAQMQLEEEMLKVLKEKQERFRQDPRFVEQIAHDIGMARPGEVIFKFREDDTASVSTNR